MLLANIFLHNFYFKVLGFSATDEVKTRKE